MLRTVYTPAGNRINVSIPDRYIGIELEILIFPINEVSATKLENTTSDIDLSFGGWSDMDKTTEEICSEIRTSRTFNNRNFNFEQ